MSWPSHGPRGGQHDWATYLERGYVTPFRDALREMTDVDVPVDDRERTMLMDVLAYAGGEQWLEIVNLLIAAGADVNRRDLGGRPVWDYAPTSGPSCVDFWSTLIRAGMDINTRGPKNETALIRVCSVYTADQPVVMAGLRSIVQLLLGAGAEVNVVDQYNDSPLSAAAGVGNIEAVKILLKAGANPSLTGNGTRSALFGAAIHGYARIVQALLRAGVDVEPATLGSRMQSFPAFTSYIVDVEGVTPLIAAAEMGYLPVVSLLVEAGADVNRSDASGFTPLMGAARAGHPQMAKFLLERGACPDAVDASGRNALQHAAEFQHQQEIAPLLRHARSKGDPV